MRKAILAMLLATAFGAGTLVGPQGVKAFTGLFVQNTVQHGRVDADRLLDKINAVFDEGYEQVIVLNLDPTAEPRAYGINGTKRVEE